LVVKRSHISTNLRFKIRISKWLWCWLLWETFKKQCWKNCKRKK